MAGRVVRLICIILMSMWLTSKAMVLSPLIAIPLIGATVVFSINEITEMRNEKNAKNKNKKRPQGHKKVTKSN